MRTELIQNLRNIHKTFNQIYFFSKIVDTYVSWVCDVNSNIIIFLWLLGLFAPPGHFDTLFSVWVLYPEPRTRPYEIRIINIINTIINSNINPFCHLAKKFPVYSASHQQTIFLAQNCGSLVRSQVEICFVCSGDEQNYLTIPFML